ncbi:nucleoporin [Sparassis latifolia]
MNPFAPSSSTNLFGSVYGKSKRTQSLAKPVPVLDLPALQSASRALQEQHVKDTQIIPDLGDLLASPNGKSSSSYSVFPDDYRVPFQKRRLIGIPEGLFKYYTITNVPSHMGLMPEIERVWVTIDHSLFLWDYIDVHVLDSFADQPDVITDVALVKPRPGIFIDEITYLLVLCTPVSVVLIGLSVKTVTGPNNRTHKVLKLYATDMTISCDVEMSSVIGTQEGRIFMCGVQDGCLYELHYQEKEGWFGKRVQIINHSVGGVQTLIPRLSAPKLEDRIISAVSDSARGCFYTLTAKNTIAVYRPSGDKSIQHVQTISNLYKGAQDIAPGSPALTLQNFQIIALHVVDPSESKSGVQLMAITTKGVRLFFAPTISASNYGGLGASAQGAIKLMQLIHVRLPPPNLLHPDEQSNAYHSTSAVGYGSSHTPQSTARPYMVSGLESSCYDVGLTIAAQPGDVDGTDYILCMSPDLTRIGSLGQYRGPSPLEPTPQYASTSYGTIPGPPRPPLIESATLLSIPGRTWAMATVPRRAPSSVKSGDARPTATNELAYQFSDSTRQFMILTNVGLTILSKRRAVDQLKDVIEESQVEGNAQPLMEFRDSYGRDQTCAMLLAVASGNTFLDIGEDSKLGTISTVSPELAVVAKQAFYEIGQRPTWAERATYGTNEGFGTAIYSGRREGFALYFARLVRPFWKAKLMRTGRNGAQELEIHEDILVTAQKNLYALKELLDTNPHLFHSAPGDHTSARSSTASEQEAWKAEQSSVSELLSLLGRTIEAISFVLLLSDHQLGDIVKHCDSETRQMVTSMTFEDLITSQNGVTGSRALVNVIINQQIGQQISVDTISEVLQQRCGSFCSTDDVMLYKAIENVRRAVETRSFAERQALLSDSLRLFMKGARILEFEKLREVCGDYQQLNYAKGAIQLPLHCAVTFDTDGKGKEYWLAGCPANDRRAKYWERRMNCYDLVLDSLSVFEERGIAAKSDAQAVTTDDPDTVRIHAYELAFASDDEIFHSTLYDWLIKRGMADELLEMRPVYLEAHLRREPITVEKFQLLWQFYVKDGQPLRAAEVLGALAESTDFNLPLEARVEYLTLAVANAKSHPISVGGRYETALAFLTDLEERLEVAQVQLELCTTLQPHMHESPEAEARIKLLAKGLMTITELYQLYAIPFDLLPMQLLILHVSEHRDENVVRPIWNKIIEEALDGVEPKVGADKIMAKVVPLGQRFYPSESAFPLRHIASLLVRFNLAHKGTVAYGWAPRILVQCGVPHSEIWDILNEMYESQIPPFNDQANVQAISSDIAVLLTDWVEEAIRPTSLAARDEFPVFRVDQAVDQYLAELEPRRTETKAAYENVKRQLRRNW